MKTKWISVCVVLLCCHLMMEGTLGYWQPKGSQRLTWVYQLANGNKIDFNVAEQVDVVDADLYDMTQSEIDKLHTMGKIVVCYVDCGTWESWRPDAASFPPSIIGNDMDGWPGEKWLDIASPLVRPPLLNRFLLAQSKQCDAIDCDNVDGYQQNTGFSISAAQQLEFNRWYAAAIHNLSMAVGLKNDVDQIALLVDSFDFAVNEQCHQYSECSQYSPFLNQDKTVFGVEYSLKPAAFCPQANALNMTFVKQDLDLNACPLYECLTETQICSSATTISYFSSFSYFLCFVVFSFFLSSFL